jgi:hypothetical protein
MPRVNTMTVKGQRLIETLNDVTKELEGPTFVENMRVAPYTLKVMLRCVTLLHDALESVILEDGPCWEQTDV